MELSKIKKMRCLVRIIALLVLALAMISQTSANNSSYLGFTFLSSTQTSSGTYHCQQTAQCVSHVLIIEQQKALHSIKDSRLPLYQTVSDVLLGISSDIILPPPKTHLFP